MRRVELNLNEMQSEEAIHSYLKAQLDLPDYDGSNMDELYDILAELRENVCVELYRCMDQKSLLCEFGKKLERVMEDAAQTVEYTDDGRMFAVFADYDTLDVSGGW